MIENHVLDEIKKISLVDYLAYLGYQPQRQLSNSYFYYSPFRNEKTPSFEVKNKLSFQSWTDYGLSNTGAKQGALSGNIICFAMKYHSKTFLEAVEILSEYQGLNIKPTVQIPTKEQSIKFETEQKEKKYQVTDVKELQSKALLQYIKDTRKIDEQIAKQYCSQVHYEYHDAAGKLKQGYAIGLKNEAGGWELSNVYEKRSAGKKTFSVIQAEKDTKNWIVFEGKYDFMAYMTEKKYQSPPSNVLILNSVSFASSAIEYLKKNEAEKVMLCQDFDRAGYVLLQNFKESFGENCYDMLSKYEGYKDYNDKIRDIKVPHFEDYILVENSQSKNWIVFETQDKIETCKEFLKFINKDDKDSNILIIQNIFAEQKWMEVLKTKQVDEISFAAAFKNHQEINRVDTVGDIITKKLQDAYSNLEDLRVHYKKYKEMGVGDSLDMQDNLKVENKTDTLKMEQRASSPNKSIHASPEKLPWQITEEEYNRRIKNIAEQILENIEKQKYNKDVSAIEILRQNKELREELRQLRCPFEDIQNKRELSYKEIILGAEQRGYDVPTHIIQDCHQHIPSFKQISEDLYLLQNDKTVAGEILENGKFLEECDLLEFKNNQANAGYYYKKEDIEEIVSHQSCYLQKSDEDFSLKITQKEEFLQITKSKIIVEQNQIKLS